MIGPKPPKAPLRPLTLNHLGESRVDEYHWLREKENSEVLSYLQAENAYTDAILAESEKLRQTLFTEMTSRLKEDDQSVPVRYEDFYYYTRRVAGSEYEIYCRKHGSLEAREEILLNCNELAQGLDFFNLMFFEPSPDHTMIAYAVDTDGSEVGTLRFQRVGNQHKLLPDQVARVGHSFEWAEDNESYFYTLLDESQRPYQVHMRKLGQSESVMIFEEKAANFFVDLSKTRSKRCLLIEVESLVTSEVHWIDLQAPLWPRPAINAIEPRRHDVRYSVEHQGDVFLIVTNDEAINYRLVEAPMKTPSRAHWSERRAGSERVLIRGVDAFAEFLVLHTRQDGLDQIEVEHHGQSHAIAFNEKAYSLSTGSNPEYDSKVLRFHYTSLVTPSSVYDYHMVHKTRELLKQDVVEGGYDPAQYESDRLWATASDGAKVPISIVYKKGTSRNATNPVYLYGYGSYGSSLPVRFSSSRLSLLDRGFVMAYAHIRGGSEMGRQWYLSGKLTHKRNTFTDFIACAEHLIAEKWTAPGAIAISGGSAGGMLVGAVANMRPELFKVVIAHVPFVDVVNTMLDPTLLLTQIEYDEWGNPNELETYRLICSYSPYDNVRAQAYPSFFVTGGFNDPRVTYWEPAKWVARLRRLKTDNNIICLKINFGAGHQGLSGRYQALHELAEEYGFILWSFGRG